jgi:hypothetical protein
MYLIGAATTGVFGFLYFGMVDTAAPLAVFVAIVLSLIPHDMQYGPRAALIAEAFTPRLRYSGASLGYQLTSVIAGGPAPLIATALFASYHSGYAISIYIAACAVVGLVAAAMMPDYTGKDISLEQITAIIIFLKRGSSETAPLFLLGVDGSAGTRISPRPRSDPILRPSASRVDRPILARRSRLVRQANGPANFCPASRSRQGICTRNSSTAAMGVFTPIFEQ